MATGQTIGQELEPHQEYEVDLLAQIEHINDPELLKQMLIQKEQERQGLSANLDLAARLGLSLHEQIQRLEQDSSAKIQSLQEENLNLHSKVNRSKDLSHLLSHSEHEVKELTGHNRFLQKELDSCRQELKTFRKDLDELSEQMAEISTEMLDAKAKVNSYARRLGEVEQELAATQELNVNLQQQLDTALQRQKQTHTTTSQAVKSIQSDLGRVFSESDSMRITLEELETRQMKCEGKVIEMMTNSREYAQLLEEAQETIHTLRIESDMEGRSWSSSHGPHAAIWDHKTGEDPEQHLREIEGAPSQSMMAPRLKDRQESDAAGEVDPMYDTRSMNNAVGGINHGSSLRMELAGYSRGLGRERADRGHRSGYTFSSLDRELDDSGDSTLYLSNQETLANELAAATISSFAAGDRAHRDSIDDDFSTPMSAPQRFSLSAELHQRLEENNILQNVLSGHRTTGTGAGAGAGAGGGTGGASKPIWTSPSTIGITHILGPITYSPRAIRDIGKTLMTLANQKGSSNPTNVIFSPQPVRVPPSNTATAATLSTATDGEMSTVTTSADVGGSSHNSGAFPSTIPSPGPRRGVVDARGVLGLKYLLSATSSADLSNVITKTTAKSPSTGHTNTSSLSNDIRARWSMTATTGTGTTTTTTTFNGSSTSSSDTTAQTSSSAFSYGKPTSSKPIPIAGGGKANNARRNRKSTSPSPASSWSATSTLAMTSTSRRPSLPDINSSSPESD
ncbi:MAG: hypothetical protein J3Q66DRAFT_355494 [Benniella sp.]|nr:MAG: hypothetical protein J3Q66DRAFT_355494 [Benniella sp.]